jgi:hypothetical protein
LAIVVVVIFIPAASGGAENGEPKATTPRV